MTAWSAFPARSATRWPLRSGSPGARLRTAFVGLAVLSLLSEAAAERPLVYLVDDAQWLDRASAETLGFVARRLLGESVVLVFAVRDGVAQEVLAGLPRLRVEGLPQAEALALLGLGHHRSAG